MTVVFQFIYVIESRCHKRNQRDIAGSNDLFSSVVFQTGTDNICLAVG